MIALVISCVLIGFVCGAVTTFLFVAHGLDGDE